MPNTPTARVTIDLSPREPTLWQMACRPDPLLIYAARRAGLFSRLVSEARLSEQTAELRLTPYEAHARMLHLDARKPEWWDPAWDWIAEERKRLAFGSY